jgi:hypothetical protein
MLLLDFLQRASRRPPEVVAPPQPVAVRPVPIHVPDTRPAELEELEARIRAREERIRDCQRRLEQRRQVTGCTYTYIRTYVWICIE